jgi:hypothetical protein
MAHGKQVGKSAAQLAILAMREEAEGGENSHCGAIDTCIVAKSERAGGAFRRAKGVFGREGERTGRHCGLPVRNSPVMTFGIYPKKVTGGRHV